MKPQNFEKRKNAKLRALFWTIIPMLLIGSFCSNYSGILKARKANNCSEKSQEIITLKRDSSNLSSNIDSLESVIKTLEENANKNTVFISEKELMDTILFHSDKIDSLITEFDGPIDILSKEFGKEKSSQRSNRKISQANRRKDELLELVNSNINSIDELANSSEYFEQVYGELSSNDKDVINWIKTHFLEISSPCPPCV